MHFLRHLFFLGLTVASYAAPVQVGMGAFSPSAVTVDFDSFATGSIPSLPGITITSSQFANLYGGSSWGTQDDPGRNTLGFQGLDIQFDSPVIRVGFVFGGNTSNSVPVTLGLGGGTTGSFTVTSIDAAPDGVTNWIFYGFEDPSGIDTITLGLEQNNSWYVGLYDLTYETYAATPLPGTLFLFATGLGGFGLLGWRRKRKAKLAT